MAEKSKPVPELLAELFPGQIPFPLDGETRRYTYTLEIPEEHRCPECRAIVRRFEGRPFDVLQIQLDLQVGQEMVVQAVLRPHVHRWNLHRPAGEGGADG